MSQSSFAGTLASQFHEPVANPELILNQYLKKAHPNSQLVVTTTRYGSEFPVREYLHTIGVETTVADHGSWFTFDFDNQKGKRKVEPRMLAGVVEFTHADTFFQAFHARWRISYNEFDFHAFVFDSPTDQLGRDLATEVYKYANALKNEIWVFEAGDWSKSASIYQAVREAQWDDVILSEEFKVGLRRDTRTFFESEEVYKSLGMTWKRGILLLGPPGNGKTESIKALLNESGRDALYVKSFTTPYGPEHGVRSIFNHARDHAPCILILEDLDAMVTSKVRSYFLNELDGLAQNHGILTIATTNHPERIDDSILNRPSRFDVKYEFTLPSLDLRKAFAQKWITKIQDGVARSYGLSLGLEESERIVEEVANRTEGWSFAFLKELFVSYLLSVVNDNSQHKANGDANPASAESTIIKLIDQLSAQILKINAEANAKVPDSDDDDDNDGRACCGPAI